LPHRREEGLDLRLDVRRLMGQPGGIVEHVLGGGALRDFSVAMFIGMVTGTYSSVYIATPVTLVWYRWKSPDMKTKSVT